MEKFDGSTSAYFHLLNAAECLVTISFLSDKYTQGVSSLTFTASQIAMIASTLTSDYLITIDKMDESAVELQISNISWLTVPLGLIAASDELFFVLSERGIRSVTKTALSTVVQLDMN